MSKPYKPPVVAVGMTVQYFADQTDQATTEAAIVVGVGDRALNVQIVGVETRTLRPMSGVRHVSDPDKQTIAMSQCGVWRHVPTVEDLENDQAEAEAAEARRRVPLKEPAK